MRFYKEHHQFYIVIGIECIFTWYWIVDFCSERSIPFVLRTIPRIGEILSLVILYEIEDIHRFPDVGNFISY